MQSFAPEKVIEFKDRGDGNNTEKHMCRQDNAAYARHIVCYVITETMNLKIATTKR